MGGGRDTKGVREREMRDKIESKSILGQQGCGIGQRKPAKWRLFNVSLNPSTALILHNFLFVSLFCFCYRGNTSLNLSQNER